MTLIETQQQELQQARESLPPAPEGLRERALETFAGLGYPTPRLEDWKYTNLREIAEGGFTARPSDAALAPDVAARLRAEHTKSANLVFVDGALASGFGRAATGVRSLANALTVDGTSVERTIAALAGIERSSLVALNTAFLGSGACIEFDDLVSVGSRFQLYIKTENKTLMVSTNWQRGTFAGVSFRHSGTCCLRLA